MIKNILSVLIFFFCLFFFYLIIEKYFSNSLKSKIADNREYMPQKIINNISDLPVLDNNTNNVIIFNSGYENENDKIKRSFWKLFKKND